MSALSALCVYVLLLSAFCFFFFTLQLLLPLTSHCIYECFIYLFIFLLFVLLSHGPAPYCVSFKWRPFCPPPPGHGYCSCGRCICEQGWFGKLCQFPRTCELSDGQSKELCETSDGVMCSGKGELFVISNISLFYQMLLWICFHKSYYLGVKIYTGTYTECTCLSYQRTRNGSMWCSYP